MAIESVISNRGPRVILGLLTFGPPGSEFHGTRVTSLDQFNECLDYFQGAGYREVDTARIYVNGLQEGWTKAAKWQERGLVLATKCYPTSPGLHAKERVKAIFEESLSELGCTKVDIFYLHAPDRSIPFDETLEACNELFQAGKFNKLGLSNYAAWEVAEIWNIANERGLVKPSIYQAMYNVLTRAIDDELIPCCRKYGLDIVVYNPLAGGVLTGKYNTKEVPTEGRYSEVDPRIGNMYRERYFRDTNFEALRIITPIAEKHKLTLREIAFRWCVHHSKLKIVSGKDGVVVGVSSIKQLEENLRDLEKGPLPDEVVHALDEAWENFTKVTCPSYWR